MKFSWQGVGKDGEPSVFFFQRLVSVVLNIEFDAVSYTDDLPFLIFHEISVLVVDWMAFWKVLIYWILENKIFSWGEKIILVCFLGFFCTYTSLVSIHLMLLLMHLNLHTPSWSVICFIFCFWQISLVEMPEHGRKKLMALTTIVMRDDSDKVKRKVAHYVFFLMINSYFFENISFKPHAASTLQVTLII